MNDPEPRLVDRFGHPLHPAIAKESRSYRSRASEACQSDPACYRNDGHEPPHMYPAPDPEPVR